jgi:hypothetical protein
MLNMNILPGGTTLVSLLLMCVASGVPATAQEQPTLVGSPIFGVTIPASYRNWQFIAPAQEAEPLDELRVIVGNDVAIAAYRSGSLPFPDGTVLVKLAWKAMQAPEFAPATIPGAPTTVQVMAKDSKRYSATGGWGFGRFVDGKPVDEAQHQTCFACHEARVRSHDYVFTRFAP